jgi:hypothetical protein
VSVTQAAFAIIGAIVGSSMLSVLIFYLCIRYRRSRKRGGIPIRREISYPKQETLVTSNASATGYPNDVKDPIPTPGSAFTGVGYATSVYGDTVPERVPDRKQSGFSVSEYVRDAPPSKTSSNSNSYSVFPKSREGSGGAGALEKVDEEEANVVSGELNSWLRSTQTVSPFGSLVDDPAPRKSGLNWPFEKRKSSARAGSG